MSAHSCWGGKAAVILPYMGFILFDGQAMSYFFLLDVLEESSNLIRNPRKTLKDHLHRMITSGGEWSFSEHTITPGGRHSLRGICSQTTHAWYVTIENHPLSFCHVCPDFTLYMERSVSIVQRLFRRRPASRRARAHRFSLIREFLKQQRLFPIEIVHVIRDLYLQSSYEITGERRQYDPVLRVKTKLFQELERSDLYSLVK